MEWIDDVLSLIGAACWVPLLLVIGFGESGTTAMGKFAMEGKHFTTSHLVSVASPNPSSHTFPSTSSAGLISLVASRQWSDLGDGMCFTISSNVWVIELASSLNACFPSCLCRRHRLSFSNSRQLGNPRKEERAKEGYYYHRTQGKAKEGKPNHSYLWVQSGQEDE